MAGRSFFTFRRCNRLWLGISLLLLGAAAIALLLLTPLFARGALAWLDQLPVVVNQTAAQVHQLGEQAMPSAIVVLGGGLTADDQGQIVPNRYSHLRYLTALTVARQTGLPVIISGVEAPFMQAQAGGQGIAFLPSEQRSMNTCENARFTALQLQRLGGVPQVILVTDAWHMARARRLFGANGVITVPQVAPLPTEPLNWWPDRDNLPATRRAVHELVALLRDRWFGEVNCREIP